MKKYSGFLRTTGATPRQSEHRHRHAQNFILMGRQRADQGAWDDARRLLLRALEYDPHALAALRLLAHAEFSLGNLPGAHAYLAQIFAASPGDPDALLVQGNIALQQGNPRAALDAYAQIGDAGAGFPDLPYNCGLAHLMLGHGPQAAAIFAQLTEEQPEHAQAWDALGCARRLERNYVAAHAAFLRALELAPTQNDTRDHLAQMLLETGNVAEARLVLRVALEQEPQRASSSHLLGVAYASANEHQLAIDCWEALLARDADAVETRYLLANAYYQLQNRARAQQELDDVIARDPTHLAAHLQLTVLCFERGDFARGRQHLAQAQTLDPQHPTVRQLLNALRILAPEP